MEIKYIMKPLMSTENFNIKYSIKKKYFNKIEGINGLDYFITIMFVTST